MKKSLRGYTLALLAIALVFMSGGVPVRAQSGSVGITPAYPSEDNPRSAAIFIHTIKPGESAKDGVMVINNTKETRTVNLGVVDSSASVDGSFSCKQNTEKQTKVGTWIKLAKSNVTLAAGTNEIVEFTITVPAAAGPGEHGGCITAQDTNSYGAKKGSGVLLGFRNGARVAITVPGKIVKELRIVRIDTKRLPNGDYTVSPVAKNSGNVSLDVQTRAQIVSNFGGQSPIKDDAKYPIMPGATMGWPYTFDRPFWGGFYKARVSISFNADPTAGIGEKTNEVKKIRGETGYFFMVPAAKAIAVYVAAVLVLPLLFIWRVRKIRRHNNLKKKWQPYIVENGETLAALAISQGVRWKKLARVNHIKPPFILNPGQEILLPVRKAPVRWQSPVRHEKAQGPQLNEESTQLDPRVEKSNIPVSWRTIQQGNDDKPKLATTTRLIYAPRPTTQKIQKKTAGTAGSKTYDWASPGSAWAPRVVSEDELEKLALSKRKTRRATAGRSKRSSPKMKDNSG